MGALTVQLPNTLQHELETQAQHEGVSISQYLIYLLTQRLKPAYTIQVVSASDIQKQNKRMKALMQTFRPPDPEFMHNFLANREVEEPNDEEERELVSKFEARIATATPDRDFAREFLANREVEEPQDQETALLIEKVEQRIASTTAG